MNMKSMINEDHSVNDMNGQTKVEMLSRSQGNDGVRDHCIGAVAVAVAVAVLPGRAAELICPAAAASRDV